MIGSDAIETLRGIPLFTDVAESDLEQIASHLIERKYPKATTVVEEGLPGDYMYIVREGRVKVTKLSEDGREKILDMLDVTAVARLDAEWGIDYLKHARGVASLRYIQVPTMKFGELICLDSSYTLLLD